MDEYSRYIQIQMHPDDKEKMTFITKNVNFCYKVMLFGLKNKEVIYQQLMNKIFIDQIGRNIKVYVDDMVAKTLAMKIITQTWSKFLGKFDDTTRDLTQKSVFLGVQAERFLDFMLTGQGIKANSNKC